MAGNRISLENSSHNLFTIEDEYYWVMAKHHLLIHNIQYPNEKQIRERMDYLSHVFLRASLCLGKPLTDREIRCIYEASCGKGTKETAESTGLSAGVIRKHQYTAFKKLRTQKMGEAIYLARSLGYLPLEDVRLLQPFKSKEAENASV